MKRTLMSTLFAGVMIFALSANQQAQAGELDSTVGTIIGAVGGGVLGSTIGKGNGRLVATAAGTVIGAVLGREIASNDYERPRRVVERERVIYHEAPPPRKKVVVVKERKYKKHKKWKRVAAYNGDILVCNKNGKRCHWYD